MTQKTHEIEKINLSKIKNLKVSQGIISLDIAAWVHLEKPHEVIHGKLTLRYFNGLSFKDILVDQLAIPIGSPALLAARACIPAELRNASLNLCLDVAGSDFRVDMVHVRPVLIEKTSSERRQKSLYAA